MPSEEEIEEVSCPECGRNIMANPKPAHGFIGSCGRRLTTNNQLRPGGCDAARAALTAASAVRSEGAGDHIADVGEMVPSEAARVALLCADYAHMEVERAFQDGAHERGDLHRKNEIAARAAHAALAALSQHGNLTGGERAWLLERADSDPAAPWYWAAGQIDPTRSSAWTQNHLAAIRFARRDDAHAVAHRLMRKASIEVRICEHEWAALLPQQPNPVLGSKTEG
jgi:hypothetical protein